MGPELVSRTIFTMERTQKSVHTLTFGKYIIVFNFKKWDTLLDMTQSIMNFFHWSPEVEEKLIPKGIRWQHRFYHHPK